MPTPPTSKNPASIVEPLLAMYAAGLFPMATESGDIEWFDPPRRGVFGLHEGGFHLSRSLRKSLRASPLRFTFNTAFRQTLEACAAPRAGQDAGAGWIDQRIIAWYTALHDAGHAHSIEAWNSGVLVGGVYGVSLRGIFAGESMFSRPELGGTNASKMCLALLWRNLRASGFAVLDCQFWTPHLGSLGAVDISRTDYQRLLWAGLSRLPDPTAMWSPATQVSRRNDEPRCHDPKSDTARGSN